MIKILFAIIIFSFSCLAQEADSLYESFPFRVDTIVIRGNDITDADIITRELTFESGSAITKKEILYNRERIFSLGIFNRVDLYTTTADTINTLIIDVEESWYIYPVPFFELKDKSWKKLSYGLDIFIKNFRGRNETVRLRGAFGFDPNFYMNYTVPSLTSDGNYYLFTELFYRDSRNKSSYAIDLYGEDFNQKFIGGALGLGRRFGIFHRVSINAGYIYIENPFYIKGISASDTRIDRFPQIGFNYIYDTRDLAQFPSDGIYFNSAAVFKGLGLYDINYRILNVDFREYRKIIGDLSGKWRLAGRFGFGDLVPTHDYSFIGFGERIRGFYNKEMEGHHYYLASAELYYPVFNDVRVNLDFIPLLPKELLHYRVGLFVQLFTDTGTAQFSSKKISYNDFMSGYGTGLTLLILPYNILRVEFAVGENGSTDWILDLGISF